MIKTERLGEGKKIRTSPMLNSCLSIKKLSLLPHELFPTCRLVLIPPWTVCCMPAHHFGYTYHPLSPWTTLASQKRVSLSPGQQQPTWQSFSYSVPGWFIPCSCPQLSITHRWGLLQLSDWFLTGLKFCSVAGKSSLSYLWLVLRRYQVLPLDTCLRDSVVPVNKESIFIAIVEL